MSAVTGQGMKEFFDAVQQLGVEYDKYDTFFLQLLTIRTYAVELQARKKQKEEAEIKKKEDSMTRLMQDLKSSKGQQQVPTTTTMQQSSDHDYDDDDTSANDDAELSQLEALLLKK